MPAAAAAPVVSALPVRDLSVPATRPGLPVTLPPPPLPPPVPPAPPFMPAAVVLVGAVARVHAGSTPSPIRAPVMPLVVRGMEDARDAAAAAAAVAEEAMEEDVEERRWSAPR